MRVFLALLLLFLSGCFLQEDLCEEDDIGLSCQREGREGVCTSIASIGRPVCLLDESERSFNDEILEFSVAGRDIAQVGGVASLPPFDNLVIAWRATTTSCTLVGPDFASNFSGTAEETFSPRVSRFGEWTLSCGDASLSVVVEEDLRPVIRSFEVYLEDGSLAPSSGGVASVPLGEAHSVRWVAFNVTLCVVSGFEVPTETIDGITSNRGEVFATGPTEWWIWCEAPGFSDVEQSFSVVEEVVTFYLEPEGDTVIEVTSDVDVELSFTTNADLCSYVIGESDIAQTISLADERGAILLPPPESDFVVLVVECYKNDFPESLSLNYLVFYNLE